jgi:Fe-S oxidoreductase
VIDGFGAHVERTRNAHQTLEGRRGRNGATLLIGCMYARRLPDVARDAVRVAAWLFGDVDVSPECCGLPLRLAGDKDAFERHASKMTSKPVVVVDPGCALALKSAGASVTLLVEHVGARVGDLPPGNGDARVMWHDPCQLGRGLGIYDAPRAVLTRVTGRAPDEFAMHHERAECSGAGGLLPLTMPEVSASIAAKRAEGARGQEIVTGCASSVVRFRRAGVPASDIVSWVARSL